MSDNAVKSEGGRLQGKDIQEYIETTFNVTYQKTQHLSFATRIKPQQDHHSLNASQTLRGKRRKLLKKFKIETILKIPGHVSLDNVNVWIQDEARFGQRNTTTRIWAEKGTRPRAVQQQQFQYVYLFGAVCVNTGQTEAIVAPVSNMGVMSKHLQLISNATPNGKHAVVIIDQASWHQAYLGEQFANLTVIHIPPYYPELNPIEQVWSWLRQNEIANRCFKDYNDIVDKCCIAWNRFCEDQKHVISLCYRDWTNLTS